MQHPVCLTMALLALSPLATLASPIPVPQSVWQPRPDDPPLGKRVRMNDLTEATTMTCGSQTFTFTDMAIAIAWSNSLETNIPERKRGKPSNDPSGRFKLGRVPHSFKDSISGFTWSANCPDGDENRQTYVLGKNGPYNGGARNGNYGPNRVVYYRKLGDKDDKGLDKVYFCGGLTHTGAATEREFLQCTVNVPE